MTNQGVEPVGDTDGVVEGRIRCVSGVDRIGRLALVCSQSVTTDDASEDHKQSLMTSSTSSRSPWLGVFSWKLKVGTLDMVLTAVDVGRSVRRAIGAAVRVRVTDI